MSSTELPEKTHREITRFITTHDANVKATFETGLEEKVHWERTNIGCDLFLAYTTRKFPAPLSHDEDLSVLQYVDYHPGGEPAWHRTVTLDFGVANEGELELELESGEKRLIKAGDVAVQKGTNHSWRNPSKTVFARALYFAMNASPVIVNGEPLEESLGVVE
ncbi:hypothetical protein HYALB_00013759 [Hymenoscyphus albidus]|uniref:Cupin type-2 domain-containing protein n=1 Tax=Hymenoscyphus albidus TaxID=595503 RepID=A0A9N9LY60_9HELO|nr:hypothetical protein HYALB_00013759 [Hymenoscyphus albidus]